MLTLDNFYETDSGMRFKELSEQVEQSKQEILELEEMAIAFRRKIELLEKNANYFKLKAKLDSLEKRTQIKENELNEINTIFINLQNIALKELEKTGFVSQNTLLNLNKLRYGEKQL